LTRETLHIGRARERSFVIDVIYAADAY